MENTNKQVNEIAQINKCTKKGCVNDAKLRCPDCVKYKIKDGSYFCGKDCFKSYWSEHKKLHEECKDYNIINLF
jgi:methionyl aminopeptidase